jgi:hypothetical protein
LTATGDFTGMDNFSFGSYGEAASTPEPDTIILGALGLAGLWFARRLRRLRPE